MNYYNEIDPQAAQWLRNLINAGHIPPGDVDDRSIEDVKPNELRGYTQHHFFAGIGGWTLALDIAGWPRDRPAFTGSCPCQSFSVAGKGRGFADKRHLWPAWFHLIRELAPPVVFGEQVAAAIRHGWLDLVSADMEGAGYAIGAAVLGAHSVGAPHIRQRVYFVAESQSARGRANAGSVRCRQDQGLRNAQGQDQRRTGERAGHAFDSGSVDQLGNPGGTRLAQQFGERGTPCEAPGRSEIEAAERTGVSVGAVVQSDCDGSLARDSATTTAGHGRSAEPASFWSGAEWIGCRDGKSRPIEPSIQPLAYGVSARVVRLRGYGNAIVPQVAAEFIRAYSQAQSEGVRIAA